MADSEDSSQTGQKRRRVEQEFIRDEKLWMEDGNVVLAASAIDETSDEKTTHVFKCHRSILAMQSKIFEGLLSMPPSTATHDMHDGLPLVALPDAYADVRDLLYILYDIEDIPRTDRNRWDICKTRKIMQKVQGPLRLAVKYEFTKLRARLIYVIESLWPVSLSQMDSRYTAVARRRQTGYRPGEEQPAADYAITLAYETGISSILPGAFYILSVESYYVGGSPHTTEAIQQKKVVTRMESLLGKLPSPFVIQFLAGRESLRETAKTLLEDIISEATLHNRSCNYTNNSEYADSEDDSNVDEEDEMRETRCAPTIEKWWDDVLKFTCSATYDPLHHMLLLERECKDIECLGKGPYKSICYDCKDAILQSIRIAREHLWNELPYLFSIKERDPSVNYGCQARLTPLFTYVP